MSEYCSPVWSPVSPNLVNHVECVQRRFTKRLSGFCSLVYNERCARPGIERLELRRLHADLTMYFKIVHGLVALQSANFLQRATILALQTSAVLATAIPYVRPSVRLSHAGIMSKRRHCQIAKCV